VLCGEFTLFQHNTWPSCHSPPTRTAGQGLGWRVRCWGLRLWCWGEGTESMVIPGALPVAVAGNSPRPDCQDQGEPEQVCG